MASKVDALAEKIGQSRAAVVNMAVYWRWSWGDYVSIDGRGGE
jgi:hypothetical protein